METTTPPIAHRAYGWGGVLLSVAAPALAALQPFLPAIAAAWCPPASVAIVVAVAGAVITGVSKAERLKSAEAAAAAGVPPA